VGSDGSVLTSHGDADSGEILRTFSREWSKAGFFTAFTQNRRLAIRGREVAGALPAAGAALDSPSSPPGRGYIPRGSQGVRRSRQNREITPWACRRARWNPTMRERSVFEQAIGIENLDARDAYVVAACHADAALLAGVRSLLRHHDAETRLPGSPTNSDPPPDLFGGAAAWEGDSAALPPLPFECAAAMVVERIGSGGMGSVFRATRVEDGAPVAIKFLLPQRSLATEHRRRFEREMEIVSSLQHEAIVPCLGTGIAHGLPYLVMPYCPAGSLAGVLSRGGSIALGKAVRLFDRILAGVAHAHERGIVHRDLKPANILLERTTNGRYRPLVADFGLAKLYDSDEGSALTMTGIVGGSLSYMPIEQLTAFREVRPATDVWSLAAIFHEAVTGRLPRNRRRGATLVQMILDHDCGSRDELTAFLPEALAEWLEKGLARAAADRHEDAGAMRAALSRAAAAAGMER